MMINDLDSAISTTSSSDNQQLSFTYDPQSVEADNVTKADTLLCPPRLRSVLAVVREITQARPDLCYQTRPFQHIIQDSDRC